MLGALLAGQPSPDLIAAVDFVVLSADTPVGLLQSMRERTVPVLLLVGAPDEVAPAVAAGVDGVIADAGSGLSTLDGIDAELSDAGRARLVSSPGAARAAFATGADLVVYDVATMVARVVADLGEGRPIAGPGTARRPLVLLSGMLGDSSLWDGVIQRLEDLVLPWPSRIDLDDSVAEMAASVLAAAPSRFALAAHSLGAIVALEIMRQQPERVTGLALVNASARAPVDRQLAAWAGWQQRVAAGEFDRVADELAVSTIPLARRDDVGLVALNRRMADAVGPAGFLRQLAAQSTRPDSLASIAAITVPVLVLSGDLDEVCPPELQRELAEHCPLARLVTIPGAGHLLPLESPAALAEQLRLLLVER